MTRYLAFAARRPWLVMAVVAVVAAGALVVAARLELHTDMAELLPPSHPAVVALDRMAAAQRLGPSVMVFVQSPDRDADLRFVDALHARLAASRAFVELDWGPDPEDARWLQHWRWLYADRATLERADALLDRIYVRHSPLFVSFDDDDDPQAELGKLELAHAAKPASAYYESTVNGTHRVGVVLWRPPPGAGGGDDHAAIREVEAAIAAVGPARFHPAMTVHVGGHLPQALAEGDSIRGDLTIATAACTVLIFAVIWLYFRRAAFVVVVGVPAVLGVVLALAIAAVTLHALNLNTAFLISIILGNGINAPIVVLARYGEERLAGATVAEALELAVHNTARGTLTAMSAASIAYGSLAITDFRGFSQFGLLGGIGMMLVWIATMVVVPPLVHIVERSGRRVRPIGWRGSFGALARVVTRRPAVVVYASVALAALAAIPIARLAADPIEWNLRKLSTPETSTRAHWDEAHALGMTHAEIGYVGSHGALLVESPDQADAVAAALRAQDVALGAPVLARVHTLGSLLPTDQAAKLAVLARMRDKIDRRADALDEADRAAVLRDRPADDLRAMTTADLPADARRAFSERDGTVGRLVLVTVDPATYSDWNGHDLIRLGRHLQVDALGQHWVAASPSTVFGGMLETLVRDAPRIAALAIVAVLVLVLAILGPRAAWRAVATQVVALAWLGGVIGLLGMKVNFFNFVALPITIGVGADYAANLVARLRHESVERAMAGTGAAVALCSLTTIIGYSSLLSSSNPALRSFGMAADLGELACLIAALVFLLALTTRLQRRMS